jgi:hypothetical protein
MGLVSAIPADLQTVPAGRATDPLPELTVQAGDHTIALL